MIYVVLFQITLTTPKTPWLLSDTTPIATADDKITTSRLEDLPKKQWKRYRYASKYV